MALKSLLATLALAAVLLAQDTRATLDSRPTSSIFVLGTTEKGDRIWRFDAATLSLSGTYEIDGSPSYCKLTPDGGDLVVTTTRRGAYYPGAVTFALDPSTFGERWIHRSFGALTWRGPTWYPVLADPTVPDTVGFFHIDPIPGVDTRPATAVEKTMCLVRRGGVVTRVPLPEHTSSFALRKEGARASIFALTSWNHLWRVDAESGESKRITERPLAPSAWLQPFDEGGMLFGDLVLVPPENRAFCFNRSGECFAVDLATGAAKQHVIAGYEPGRRISFVHRSETTGHVVLANYEEGGTRLSVLTPGLKEQLAVEVRDVPFVDAAFAPDGQQFATLTEDGFLRLHDVARGLSLQRSEEPLPLMRGVMHDASIAGWR
jgi:hypothetical protein